MTWREVNVEARERGAYSDDEQLAAQSWGTCAISEQREAHPFVVMVNPVTHSPKDETLAKLGGVSGFAIAVWRNDFDEADRLLDAIEDRVLQLKREAVAP